MSRDHSRLSLSIELSPNIHASHTRQRCPSARLRIASAKGARDLGSLRVDVEKPRFDIEDASLQEVDAEDTIGKVIDEAAWLAEIARVLAPGGTFRCSVPASGPFAWWDTQNIYRYAVDILGRGDTPDATLPTGWNRHYGPDDVIALMLDAGFTGIEIRRAGIGIAEGPQLTGLMIRNFLLGDREAERKLYPFRRAMEKLDARIPAPAFGTSLLITAKRAHAEPDDPADKDVSDNRPAPEIDSE